MSETINLNQVSINYTKATAKVVKTIEVPAAVLQPAQRGARFIPKTKTKKALGTKAYNALLDEMIPGSLANHAKRSLFEKSNETWYTDDGFARLVTRLENGRKSWERQELARIERDAKNLQTVEILKELGIPADCLLKKLNLEEFQEVTDSLKKLLL